MTNSQIVSKAIGHYVRIRFVDIGLVDGIVVSSDPLRAYIPATDTLDNIEPSQIETTGPLVRVPKF